MSKLVLTLVLKISDKQKLKQSPIWDEEFKYVI